MEERKKKQPDGLIELKITSHNMTLLSAVRLGFGFGVGLIAAYGSVCIVDKIVKYLCALSG